ncbi:MAG: VCBS repeat-containing protein, partial [Olleya sp.]
MKKNLLSTTLFFVMGLASAQTIDVSLFVPATPFQDADVGAMAFADIDNDGDQDLLISGKGGPIKTTLYINDGIGNYTEATGTPFVNVYDGTVGFADVNNDNFIDLLVTGATSAPIKTSNLYINNGNGTFSIAPTPFTPSRSGDFAFADIDNDNDKDLIMTGINANDNGFTKMYVNNGSGNFSEVVSTPFEQLNNSSVAFIDIENDGDLDVVLAGANSSSLVLTKLYTNNGTGIYTLNNNNLFEGFTTGDIAIADSDNDGDNDILITGQGTSNPLTKLYANNGTGTFTEVLNTPFAQAFVSATEFADFDNDGDKDIFLVGARFGNPAAVAHIYQNQGNNTFVLSNDLIATYLA